MNIILSSIFDPLREYFTPSNSYKLNDILKLRLVCKQFASYMPTIFNMYTLKINEIERFNIPENILNLFSKCEICIDTLKYGEFKKIVGNKFVKSNIKSYRFYYIHKIPISCLKHFKGAETYIVEHSNFTDEHFKHLKGAKHYSISHCNKLTHEFGKYIGGAETYSIGEHSINLKPSLLFEYVSGAKEYRFHNCVFHHYINDNMKYIAGAEKYYINNFSFKSTDNLKYITGAREYEFENCEFKQADFTHLKGAQKYKFTHCKFDTHILNINETEVNILMGC